MQETKRFYLPQLDGVRFLAFVLIFNFHGREMWKDAAPHFFDYGWFALDLFFLLSSFLITSLLIKEFDRNGRVDLKRFWIRRGLRVWPLYFLVVGLYLTVFPALDLQYLSPPPGSAKFQAFKDTYLASLFFFYFNWEIIQSGWPSTGINDLWSVSVEEQFYFVWPLLMRFVRRKYIAQLFAFLLFIAVATRFSTTGDPHWVRTFVNTAARLDPFVFGGLLAVLYNKPERFMKLLPYAWPVTIAAFVFLYLGLVAAGPSPLQNTRHAIWQFSSINVGVAFFVLATLINKRLAWLLSLGPIAWLGKLTYGLYLFHRLALAIAWELVPNPTTTPRFLMHGSIGFALSIAFAALSYYAFEARFLRLKERFATVHSRPV